MRSDLAPALGKHEWEEKYEKDPSISVLQGEQEIMAMGYDPAVGRPPYDETKEEGYNKMGVSVGTKWGR